MTASAPHPLVEIISDTRSVGWECVPAVVSWLQQATDAERLEAYPLVRMRVPDRTPRFHLGL